MKIGDPAKAVKRVKRLIVFIPFFSFLITQLPNHPITQFLYAEVTLLEPLRPGIEGKIPEKTSAIVLEGVGFALGEDYWELPFLLAFRPTADYEFGARVSIRANKQTGKWMNSITDTLITGKYLFFQESIAYPTIFAEAGISLPSGEYSRGFGNGASSFLFAGGMERTIGEIHEHIFLNYRYNLKNADDYQFGNVFGYTAGFGYPLKKPVKLSKNLILLGDWKIFGELKGWYHTDDSSKGINQANAYHELYFCAGGKYKSKWGKYAGSLLFGLTKQSYSYQIYLSARY